MWRCFRGTIRDFTKGGAWTCLYPLTKKRAKKRVKPAVPLVANYRLIDIPVSNCLNNNISKIDVLTQFNSVSLNRHMSRAYASNKGSYKNEGFVEVLAAKKSPKNPNLFRGTAAAVRQYLWLFKEHNVLEYLILAGDHLYRTDYERFVQAHRETDADITVAAIPMNEKRATAFGLMKIDEEWRIKAMKVFTAILGLDEERAKEMHYIASMGIYVASKDVMLDLLRDKFPGANDFGSEVIPGATSIGLRLRIEHTFMMAIGKILVPLRLSTMPNWESQKSQSQTRFQVFEAGNRDSSDWRGFLFSGFNRKKKPRVTEVV